MELTSAKIASIRLARPQEEGAKPDAIFEMEFNFDGPNDAIGPQIVLTVPVEYDESRAVLNLRDAALTAALALLNDLARTDRSRIEALLREGLTSSSYS